MISQQWYRSLGVGIPVISALLFFGLVVSIEENLFNSGITAGMIFGILNVFLAWAVYKNRI